MDTMSEHTSAPQRATLNYKGTSPRIIGGTANAIPRRVQPGQDVEVNADVAEQLIGTGLFTATGRGPEVLRGEALDDALRGEGLAVTGSADEKRQRLAEHHAAQAAGIDAHGDTNDDAQGEAQADG